jgi:hypothetical protein
MSAVILYLRAMMRELDMSIMKARIFAGDLVDALSTLCFEPVNWVDTTTHGDIAISTTKEGYLRAFVVSQGEYVSLYRLSMDDVLRLAFRVLHLVESGILKLKEEP